MVEIMSYVNLSFDGKRKLVLISLILIRFNHSNIHLVMSCKFCLVYLLSSVKCELWISSMSLVSCYSLSCNSLLGTYWKCFRINVGNVNHWRRLERLLSYRICSPNNRLNLVSVFIALRDFSVLTGNLTYVIQFRSFTKCHLGLKQCHI